jgi:PKD repeat protein
VINNTLKINDIYYSNPILTYLFQEKGYYTVKLTLRDSNGNKNTITKNILNII